jgi:hypothetical protein
MEQVLGEIFGVQNHLSTTQEGARAVLIFAYGLLLLRLKGTRVFGLAIGQGSIWNGLPSRTIGRGTIKFHAMN